MALGSLPGDPLANVCRAVFEACAICFAVCEEGHRVALDELHLTEIERQRTTPFLALDDPSKLAEIFPFDAATQHEAYALALLGPLNPQHPKDQPHEEQRP